MKSESFPNSNLFPLVQMSLTGQSNILLNDFLIWKILSIEYSIETIVEISFFGVQLQRRFLHGLYLSVNHGDKFGLFFVGFYGFDFKDVFWFDEIMLLIVINVKFQCFNHRIDIPLFIRKSGVTKLLLFHLMCCRHIYSVPHQMRVRLRLRVVQMTNGAVDGPLWGGEVRSIERVDGNVGEGTHKSVMEIIAIWCEVVIDFKRTMVPSDFSADLGKKEDKFHNGSSVTYAISFLFWINKQWINHNSSKH